MSDWIAADWPAPDGIVAGTTLRTHAAGALPLDGQPCWLDQVHGSEVVTAGRFETPPCADASVSGLPQYICTVRTADCLPVLMCSIDGRVFAAAHAGWRGLAAGIIENTISRLDVDPSDLLVWLGPAISQAAFEVGEEVKEAFLAADPGAGVCFERNDRGRWQADLYALARRRLEHAGVSKIHGGGFCTYSDSDRFYSYRRNADCGRLLSFVGRNTP